MSLEIKGVIDWSIILTLVAVFITIIGRNISKSKKKITKDFLSENLDSLFMIVGLIFLPGFIIYFILGFEQMSQSVETLKGVALLIAQLLIMMFYFKFSETIGHTLNTKKKNKVSKFLQKQREKGGNPEKATFTILSLINATILFIQYKIYVEGNNPIFTISSIVIALYGILIMIQLSKYHSFQKDKRVRIKTSKGTIEGNLEEMGSEFIEVKTKKGKRLNLNKTNIISIEEFN